MLATLLRKCFHPNGIRVLNQQSFMRPVLPPSRFNFVIPVATMASKSSNDKSNRVVVNQSLTYFENANRDKANRTLVLLFSWMLAKGRHLDKFNQFYANHGYDVLIVNTLPMQLMFPARGTIQNAQHVLQFIADKQPLYSSLIVHGFSVGAYQFGEVLARMSQDKEMARKIAPLFRALIFDSAANLAAIPDGFSRALTPNKVLQRIIYYLLHFYLKCFYFVATKYYQVSEKEFYEMNHFRVPSLLLVSECDPVGSVSSNQVVAQEWKKRGIPVRMKVWKDSKHVSHYHKYTEEYEQELNQLLEKIK